MSLNAYLFGIKVSTVVAFFAWASVVLYIDPKASGVFGVGLFSLTLFLWLSGVVTLLITWLRKKMSDEERVALTLGESLRQGAFVSLFVLSMLGLQYFSILEWWSGALLTAVFLLFELKYIHAIPKEVEEKHIAKPHTRKR